jgi:hypothetical protein
MPEREVTPEREKRRKDIRSKRAPGSSSPPSEDAPEQEVTPEAEGEALETEGETSEKIEEPSRDTLVTKTKLDKRKIG